MGKILTNHSYYRYEGYPALSRTREGNRIEEAKGCPTSVTPLPGQVGPVPATSQIGIRNNCYFLPIDHTFCSDVSAGGTRRVRRRRRLADGTYGTDEEYHSDESIRMKRAAKKHKKNKKKKGGSDSEYRSAEVGTLC